MQQPDTRSIPIATTALSQFFASESGYYPMGNSELAGTLLRWKLNEEPNRNNADTARAFLRWSLTASFLQFANALQWFAAALLLERASFLPAQTMQQHYYSIFFSFGSFLAMQGKGQYTIDISIPSSDDMRPVRRELWLNEMPPDRIEMRESRGGGGEHERRANWFYDVFSSWDQKDRYPAVLSFKNDRRFHTGFRNMYTYSLGEMAEELHHDAPSEPTPNNIILSLWNGDRDLPDYYPEEFWVLEHLRPPLDFHARLINEFAGGNPLTYVQKYILTRILALHQNDSVAELIRELLSPFAPRLQGFHAA